MSVVAPPEPPRPEELEALIREARARRRRRRWIAGAAVVGIVAGATLGISSILEGASSKQARGEKSAVVPPPRCRSGQLRLAGYPYNVGAGSETTGFSFTNASEDGCTLHGWPTLELVMPGGRIIPAHGQRVRLTEEGTRLRVEPVLIRPGSHAAFGVVGINQVGRQGPLDRRCSAGARAVLVTPPGARLAVRVAYHLTYCGPRSLWIYPVAAGRVDRQRGK